MKDEPLEPSYEDALAVLNRLAASAVCGGTHPPRNGTPLEALPPRVEVLPAWSERSFRDLVEALPDGIVVIDERGAIVLVNQQAERLFGYTRSELLGQLIEILVPDRLRSKHVGQRAGYMSNPHTRPLGGVDVELFGQRKDGSQFPVEISLSPLYAPSGVLITSIIRDISFRKREEAKFKTLVEHIPAVTFIAPLDQSAPEMYVSPQIEKLLGFSQKEWLEDPILWHRQLHPDDQERWNRHFAPTCSEATDFRSIYRFLAKDGHVVWVHGSANVIRDTEGKMLFLMGIAFDVSAIKEAEEERDRFFALSLDLFCIAGMDGTLQRINQAFIDTLGYPATELVGRPFLDLVHPDDREATLREQARLARGEKTDRFENRYRCADGSYRWLQWVAAPYLDKQLIFAAARDVTREKQDEEALREQARLAVLRADVSAAMTSADSLDSMLARCVAALTEDLDDTFAGIWTLHDDASVLTMRGWAGNGTGDGPPGRIPMGTHTIGRIAHTRQSLCSNRLHGDERIDDQAWARRNALVAFAGYPLLIDNRLVGVLALFAGQPFSRTALETLELIAAQIALGIKSKQSEEALLRANAELERRVQERTEALARSLEALKVKKEELEEFAYHATHDLKEPLRTTRTNLQLLQREATGNLSDKAADRISRGIASTTSMQQLLLMLRDYEHVTRRGKIAPVDCAAAVSQALVGLQTAIEESAVTLRVADDLPTVRGNEAHLVLLFQNLIGNAIKYRAADRPPCIEVGAQRGVAEWLFWVRDNGVGIEEKYWNKIFGMGPESRLGKRSQTEGWGYGLAICRKTVERHGGWIRVASEVGQGSTFYFTLPDTPPEEEPAVPE